MLTSGPGVDLELVLLCLCSTCFVLSNWDFASVTTVTLLHIAHLSSA